MATQTATPSRTRSAKKAAKSVASEVLPAENVGTADMPIDFKRAQLNHAFELAKLRREMDDVLSRLDVAAPKAAPKAGRVPKKAAK